MERIGGKRNERRTRERDKGRMTGKEREEKKVKLNKGKRKEEWKE